MAKGPKTSRTGGKTRSATKAAAMANSQKATTKAAAVAMANRTVTFPSAAHPRSMDTTAMAAIGLEVSVSGAQNVPDFAALVAAPDRSDADRTADKRRDPVKILAFSGVRPGMKVSAKAGTMLALK